MVGGGGGQGLLGRGWGLVEGGGGGVITFLANPLPKPHSPTRFRWLWVSGVSASFPGFGVLETSQSLSPKPKVQGSGCRVAVAG